MAKDDYFKIVFVILTELYECKKLNERVNLKAIHPERFGIPDGYLLDILSELLDEGYVKGFEVLETKSGRTVCGLDDIGITMRGIEYLQDNGKMKKVYEAMKEIRDWVPGL
mgnify:CR=1 FL=1